MKLSTGIIIGVSICAIAASAQTIENVRAQQRPRSKIVEVYYDLVAPEGGTFDVSVSFSAPGKNPNAATLEGDVGEGVLPGRNKRILWDAGADWPDNVDNNFEVTVHAKESGGIHDNGMVLIPGGTISGNRDGWRLGSPPPDILEETRFALSSGGYFIGRLDFYVYGNAYSRRIDQFTYTYSSTSFFMDKIEVTYALWSQVYLWGVSHGYDFDYRGGGKGPDHPVHSITGYDMLKWCNARSEMDKITPVYTVEGEVYRRGRQFPDIDFGGAGYRLPTRNEWFYAARGGVSGYVFPVGDTINHGKANYQGGPENPDTRSPYVCYKAWIMSPEYGNRWIEYAQNYLGESSGFHPLGNDGREPYTIPAGSLKPNPLGLFDMAGNVEEFVYEGGVVGYQLGGSYKSESPYLSFAYQDSLASSFLNSPNQTVGFRCVRK